VQNAGSVFIGKWSAEALGDYASGPNHVLPTYGYAKSYSGLGVESFMKSITFQEVSKEGLLALAPTVETLAQLEGLDAHKTAVNMRRKMIEENL
jgi:histidinol dehydrogenase